MGRVDENYEVLSIINKSVEAGTYDASEAISLILCDISRSLAIIADKMEAESEDQDADIT